MSENLPSIDDLLNSKLPSIDEVIKEEKLPSVNDFIENPDESDEIESGKEEVVDTTPCSVEEEVEAQQDLTEIVRLINDVRKDIPEIPVIPEIKYYDEQLEQLTAYVEEIKESIPEIPEPKSYDVEVEAICGLIDTLREEIKQNISDLPEVKYYDEQVSELENRLNNLPEFPEVRYYEEDIKSLKEDILTVKESIPKFPKWVNEVNEVPDFSWIGKTFSVIDDDFVKLNDNLDFVKGRIDQEVQKLTETIDVKEFEARTDITLLNKNLKETKDKIYKELREAALSIHDAKHGYKNDDRLLKKDILSRLNVLKQRVEEEVTEFNRKNLETKDIFDGYFTSLTEEIANLPEVKYYDEDIKEVRKEFKIGLDSLKILVEEIKGKHEVLKEEVNSRPIQPDPSESNIDPLTPTDQNFATHEDLAKHYKLFINRIQQQLYTIGGGGAGFIKDLDDVDFDQTTGLGQLLIYDGSQWVGIASTALDKSSTLHEALTQGNVSGIGMSVGVITATNGYFSGIVTAAQLNYDVVTDIYSTGIVTATKGIQQTGSEGLHVTAGVSTFVGLTSCLAGLHVRAGSANTALIVEGHGRITGILTIGTGSITLDAANNKVNVGTGITLNASAGTIEVYNTTTETTSTVVNPSGEANYTGIVTAAGGVNVGTAASIYANGNISCGILTATNFIGDGSGLTGVANTDNVVSTTLSVSGVVTAIGGLYVGTAASIFANGNITGGIVTATKYYGDGSSLSNVTSTTINNNADNRLITGSGTANTLEGESTLTYNGTALSVSTGATVFTNGNITCGIITATSFTVAGTSLAETIADTVGGMVSSNTESGITVAYQDADNTLDFTVGTLNQDTSGTAAGLSGTPNITVGDVVAASLDISGNADIDGTLEADAYTVNGTALDTHIAGVTVTNATNSSHVLVTDNESTDEDNLITFVEGATSSTGNVGLEMDGNLTYNPSTGRLTATQLAGTLQTAAQANVTSLGTLTTLTVDNVIINGTNIGHTSDTDLMTLSDGSVNVGGDVDNSTSTQGIALQPGGKIRSRVANTSSDAFIVSVENDGGSKILFSGAGNGYFADGVRVATAATISTNGNITCGIITATNLVGNGSGLTNISGIPSESDTAVSTTNATTILTIDKTAQRAAFVDVLITQGSAYQSGQYGLIHDGTTATIVEKFAMATGSMLGTFTVTISGDNMLMQVNMGSSSSATVTVKSSTITV